LLDAEPVALCRVEVHVYVAARVHDCGRPGRVVDDEGREMAETRELVLLDAHPPSLHPADRRRPDPGTYIITRPPSTARTWPVMKAASSEARNATACAISSGVPNRPSGVRAVISAWSASGRSWVSSVRTNPGATALTVMEREASSRATALVKPMRPAFADE